MAAPLGTLPPLRPGFVRLLLARHGESLGNERQILDNRVHGDADALTAAGRAQAASLGAALRDAGLPPVGGVVCVGSSAMQRAIETASIIAREVLADTVFATPSEALVEIDNGNLDGRLIGDIRADLQAVLSAWRDGRVDVRVGGTGDSPRTLQDRALGGLRGLLGDLPPDASHLLVVAHVWTNRTLLALWLGQDLSKLAEIQQPNAGLSVVDVSVSDVRTADVHVVGWQPPVAAPGPPPQ